MTWLVETGDCLDVLSVLPEASIDAVVTDPPYGLGFMGKAWDHSVPSALVWRECLRVLKPGGHLLAFAGTRTQHRMAVNIEDAGFEIRDMIAWVYGSGFPKSLDVSKAIDKAAGAERELVGVSPHSANRKAGTFSTGNESPSGYNAGNEGERMITAPATESALQWQGWGTALKPALEPITVARKPLDGTVAANVLKHGTGALNIDGCRVGSEGGTRKGSFPKDDSVSAYGNGINGACEIVSTGSGRWPANLIHDGSDEVTDLLGEAARFFYCPKASKRDREEGLDAADDKTLNRVNPGGLENDPRWKPVTRKNNHPTVKPTDLMRYLVRLVTPPGGLVLDPFCGSGSTGKAAVLEGFDFCGIDISEEYAEIARARIAAAAR